MTCQIDRAQLPPAGAALIRALERAGHEAWFVGGCVRDLLLGRIPHRKICVCLCRVMSRN